MSCIDWMLADFEVAYEEMRWWVQLHGTRKLIAGIPACFLYQDSEASNKEDYGADYASVDSGKLTR